MKFSILNFFTKENLDANKIRIEVIAIILGGLFVLWKWGAEVYWARQPSFSVYFHNLQSGNSKQAVYLKEANVRLSNQDYCNLEGVIGISNTSVAPMHIENTTLHFIPFKVNQCQSNNDISDDCLITNTASSIYDRICQSQISHCPQHHELTILPVDELPVFGTRVASRPFNLAIPKLKDKNGLLVIAEQQIGRGCISKDANHRRFFDWWDSCATSRAFIADTNFCVLID